MSMELPNGKFWHASKKGREMLTQAVVHAHGSLIKILNVMRRCNGHHVILEHASCFSWSTVVCSHKQHEMLFL